MIAAYEALQNDEVVVPINMDTYADTWRVADLASTRLLHRLQRSTADKLVDEIVTNTFTSDGLVIPGEGNVVTHLGHPASSQYTTTNSILQPL